MTDKKSRRAFLGKLTLGFSALSAFPLLGFSKSKNEKEEMEKHPINKIKALGFQWETQDPFLFCVHHEDKYPKGNESLGLDASLLKGRYIGQDFIVKDGFRMYHGKEVPGFPGHPHRGFETITVVREGLVDHADSTGAAGRYGNGDVQWMTAGKGVQHSEMFPLLNKDKENPFELFQIWLNLPKKSKMVEPDFKMLWHEDIPVLSIKDDKGKFAKVEVIAGAINNTKAVSPPKNSWAAEAENCVGVFNITLEPGATFRLDATDKEVNRTIYYYIGNNLRITDYPIPHYHAVEVDADKTLLFENGGEESRILVLQGKPINEPVVQHGPFVMNTKEEIKEAFNDYHRTQFGGWPWPKFDQVHDEKLGRFAKHANGNEEVKG